MPKLTKLTIFDNSHIEEYSHGHFVVSTEVVESSLNLYGKGHGGYLFAIADETSGCTVLTTGKTAVTLNSSINYIKAANLGDRLTVTGTTTHEGRSTLVIDVTIHNQEDQLIAKACFTMYVTGEVPEQFKGRY